MIKLRPCISQLQIPVMMLLWGGVILLSADSLPAQGTAAAPTAKPIAASAPTTKPAAVSVSAPTTKPAATAESTAKPSAVVPTPSTPNYNIPPKPIEISKSTETLEERLARQITLDVREMNVVDVLKFLAIKGDFNMVTSNNVSGRVTLYLKNVKIIDALDIVLISNNLAYHMQNGIIHVLPEAEYEAMFGKKYNDKNKVSIVQLKYAKPSYILSTLDNMKSSLGKIIIDEDTGQVVMIDTPQVLDEMKKMIDKMESPLEAYVYSLQYAKADVVAEKLKARIDSNAVGSITTDERSNKIIIRAFPERRKEVEGIIKSLDVPTKEVLVEGRVLQIVFKPQFDIGIDWQYDFKENPDPEIAKTKFKNIFLNDSSLPSSDPLFSTFTKIGAGNFNTDKFAITLRALKQVSDTKILSHPKLLVTNNEEARIHVGDTIPYIISTTSGTGDNAITSEDVRFVDVGIKLSVTPTINDDQMVTMRLKPEISTVVGKITSKGGGIPQVNKTEVETSAIIKDGATIILGGLIKDNKVHTKKGFPVLMDIPWVDKLFSRTSDSLETTEIVIFITPHIIKPDQHYDRISGEIKPSKPYETNKTKDTEEDLGMSMKLLDSPPDNPAKKDKEKKVKNNPSTEDIQLKPSKPL